MHREWSSVKGIYILAISYFGICVGWTGVSTEKSKLSSFATLWKMFLPKSFSIESVSESRLLNFKFSFILNNFNINDKSKKNGTKLKSNKKLARVRAQIPSKVTTVVRNCWQVLAAVGSCWQLLAAVGRWRNKKPGIVGRRRLKSQPTPRQVELGIVTCFGVKPDRNQPIPT